MKTHTLMFAVVSTTLALAFGCSKKEEPTTPLSQQAPADAGAAADVVQKAADTAKAGAETVKQKAAEAIADTQAQADAASSKVSGLIEQAKQYLAQNKPSEALAALGQLGNLKLTPEQQSLVKSLKEQAQKAMAAALKTKGADEAGKAVGGLLPNK